MPFADADGGGGGADVVELTLLLLLDDEGGVAVKLKDGGGLTLELGGACWLVGVLVGVTAGADVGTELLLAGEVLSVVEYVGLYGKALLLGVLETAAGNALAVLVSLAGTFEGSEGHHVVVTSTTMVV